MAVDPPAFASALSQPDQALVSTWSKQAADKLLASQEEAQFVSCLDSIPSPEESPLQPIALLAELVARYPSRPPTFELLRRYIKLSFALPESIKAGRDENATSILQELSGQITADLNIPTLFIPDSQAPALIDPTTKKSITHQSLSSFINYFSLPLRSQDTNVKPVVSLALPNGYLLGLVTLSVASYYTVAPLNIGGGAAQFESDVHLASPQCILVLESDVEKLGLDQPWVSAANIQVLLVSLEADMTFSVRPLENEPSLPCGKVEPSSAEEIALILFTSGTSGTKKVVPTTVLGLLMGVTCVIDSWGLTSQDSCINMMPLNHVGGLVRNLFAPVLAGGSTILCPAFDPNLFWDTVEDGNGTWYYASPSMHMSILWEGDMRPTALAASRVRLVCNAAGGLLPALALRLRDTFKCTVLPSYGMTECMPISTPPLSYTLDRPGTSGIGCGPEMAILDDAGQQLPPGEKGRISVRGGPTFPGYLKNGKIDKSIFDESGWFDTGDLGMLDADGYLYITGRGKEVINRGGEIISPFEVEEAITIASQHRESPLFGRVKQVLAFSAPHETLQEVVGVVLVCPSDQPRPDVRDLHNALKTSLHNSKWPIAVVYMEALPTSNNKLVRIKFAERMDMAAITDDTTLLERHFNAICPPINSLLTTKIPNNRCELDVSTIQKFIETHTPSEMDAFVGTSHHDGTVTIYLAPSTDNTSFINSEEIVDGLRNAYRKEIDGYLVPSTMTYIPQPLPRTSDGTIDEKALEETVKSRMNSKHAPASSETEEKIRAAFALVLDVAVESLGPESDFFELGGGSMSAGRLLSIIRRDLGARLPIDQIFTNSRICDICELVDQILDAASLYKPATQLGGSTKTYSSTNPIILLLNLTPIMLMYPMKTAYQWTALIYCLSMVQHHWTNLTLPARYLGIIGSMFVSRAAVEIVSPFIGIILKWVIIGKYREGMYPMWGFYHTRWWIVERILQVCGKGIFQYFDSSRLLYYRLLGAKIGRGVTITSGTEIGEYDLLDLGDNVRLDRCVCRPFAAEHNTSMYLGQITIGRNSSVGLKSQIAAGSTLPEDTYIGPNSSSYEMDNKQHYDGRPLPQPHLLTKLFFIIPLRLVVLFISSLPWMAALYGIFLNEPQLSPDVPAVYTTIAWWAGPIRIGFHYLARAADVALRPFVWFTTILVIKKTLDFFCGPATPKSMEERTSADNFRTQVMSELVPNGDISSLTKLFGKHYEITSKAVRLMGGKIGKRIYWPGTGPNVDNYDLLEIGDDVVFGSRSRLITTDGAGSRPVKIGAGSMIADRVILNPGSKIGEGAIIGSGAYIRSDQSCYPETVWVGNKHGSAVCLSSPSSSQSTIRSFDKEKGFSVQSYEKDSKESSLYGDDTKSVQPSGNDTSSPFSRAFYDGKASYRVYGQTFIYLYCTLITMFVEIYWNVSTVSTIIINLLVNFTTVFGPNDSAIAARYRPIVIYLITAALISALYTILAILALLIVIAAKWILLGRRRPGNYDWDKSSYCQRWQLFLNIEALRSRCFQGSHGLLGMLSGTHYLVLYFRAMGAKIGKDCALFAGGRPSLMFTEPDLVTLGDRVALDDCSLVGHINSRGTFDLNELSVGSRSVLRSGTRLLSGAKMGEDAILLEHTLIMGGDTADDGVVYQGWPADVYRGDRLKIVSGRSTSSSSGTDITLK